MQRLPCRTSNHRLQALRETDYTGEVTSVIEPSGVNVHSLAVEDNRDEDTYAPMDLFDYLDIIDVLRENKTQAEIGEEIGWSLSKVKKHYVLLNEIVPEVLDLARGHQKGRVTEKVTSVTFTEGWFRDSGLYDLSGEWAEGNEEPVNAQERLMQWFIDGSSGKTKSKI